MYSTLAYQRAVVYWVLEWGYLLINILISQLYVCICMYVCMYVCVFLGESCLWHVSHRHDHRDGAQHGAGAGGGRGPASESVCAAAARRGTVRMNTYDTYIHTYDTYIHTYIPEYLSFVFDLNSNILWYALPISKLFVNSTYRKRLCMYVCMNFR